MSSHTGHLCSDTLSSLLEMEYVADRVHMPRLLVSPQVHHRLFVCSNAHEQKCNTQGATTVVNISPGSERISATGLKVSQTCAG